MRKQGRRKLTALSLSLLFALSVSGCGKKETVVEDYGSTDVVTESSETDADYSQGDGKTLKEMFGDRVKWKETIGVQGVSTKVDLSIDIPDTDFLNVYKSRSVSHDQADEDRIVKALFGDTGKKLEELKYTNETDYITFLDKYRDILNYMEGKGYNFFDDPEAFEEEKGAIGPDFPEVYRWLDETNRYIHMYEGEYNGIKYGLLLAYDGDSEIKYVFLDPISIKDYFPDKDYKTMVYETNTQTMEKISDVKNECSMSYEDATKKAQEFLKEIIGLNETDNCVGRSSDLYHAMAGLPMYGLGYNDGGPVALTFSDKDYVSTLQNSNVGSGAIGIERLAAQKDLMREGMEKYKCSYYEFLMKNNTAGTEDPTLSRNGYAVYLQSPTAEVIKMENMYSMDTGNTGVIKMTDKGVYGAELLLFYETEEIIEDVELLDFEKIKTSLKNALEEKLDMKKMGDTDILNITMGALKYESYCSDENSDKYSQIPVWTFYVESGNVDYGEDGVTGLAEISINAMDGSVNRFEDGNGYSMTGGGSDEETMEVDDGE